MTGKHRRYLNDAYQTGDADTTRDLYQDWADVYDTELETENDYRMPARCARALVQTGLRKDAAVLDAGCGTGLSGKALAASGFTVIDGCDLSSNMLRQAEQTRLYRHLFEADLNQPIRDVSDESYDAVTAVGVFSHGHIAPGSIDGILRVLKPGGPFIAGMNDRYYESDGYRAKFDDLERTEMITHVRREHGAHIPGRNIEGWVISMRKALARGPSD